MQRFLGRFAVFGYGLALGAAALSVAGTSWAASTARPDTVPAPAASQSPARDHYEGPPLLLGNGKKVKVGAYGGMGGAYTRMMGKDSGLLSLEGALLFDHRLSLGIAGYGFTRTPRGPTASDGTPQRFSAGYGGLALRYSVIGNLPVYATLGVVLGAGAVNLRRDYGDDAEFSWHEDWGHDDADWDKGRFDMFLFAQPEIALNTNITRWLRLGATVGYRFTGGVNRFCLCEADLNGIVAGGNLQVGWF